MRWNEIVEDEVLEAAPNLPTKYMVDPETDLALNLPNQWSESPYLYAVKAKKRPGYLAQLHTPQDVWTSMVDQNPSKWRNAPKTFFNDTGNQRAPMVVSGFEDPREAAWFGQEIMFGGDHAPRDYFEDYFDMRYNGGDGQLIKALKARLPSFDGEILTVKDLDRVQASQAERQQAQTVSKNTAEYQKTMAPKIKTALKTIFMDPRNKALARKRLGQFKSRNELERLIDQKVDQLGVDHFLTTPGGVKLKDLHSISF